MDVLRVNALLLVFKEWNFDEVLIIMSFTFFYKTNHKIIQYFEGGVDRSVATNSLNLLVSFRN